MAVPLSYTLFEIFGLIWLVVIIIFQIKKKDKSTLTVITELLLITAFGITVEIGAMMSGIYVYPPFNIMIFNAPLIIGVGWGTILFSAMWLTDSLEMPEWCRVFMDAFLALLIDLSMDAIAIRDIYTFDTSTSGMWAWDIPFDAEWFGVPWFNFTSWWFIIFSMSTALRLTRLLIKKKKNSVIFRIIFPILALVLALGFLSLTGRLTLVINQQILFIIQMSLSVIIMLWKLRKFKTPISLKNDFPIYFVPLTFHLFFLVLGIVKGYYIGTTPILLMSLGTFFLHIIILIVLTLRSRKQFN
ncbi:MAG: hypothetical protein GY870_01300 [archaeon]|nr:hypothetical protein [archaeon]